MACRRVTIENPAAATPTEARRYLAQLFPSGGTYYLKSAGERTRAVTLSDGAGRADNPLPMWRAFFPVAGVYVVADSAAELLKGTPPPTEEGLQFQEWWLERLLTEARGRATSTRQLMRRAVEGFIAAHAGALTDPHTLAALQVLMGELEAGVRYTVTAPIRAGVVDALRGLGFSDRDVIDFVGVAYRLGMVEEAIRTGGRVSWPELLRTAATAELSATDEAAIAYARERVAAGLTPVLLRDGRAATLEALDAEQRLVRTLAADAVRARLSAPAFARQLYKRLDLEEGIVRDWDRVARTELQDARVRGAFEADRQRRDWGDETQVFRMVAAVPCNACLMLYVGDDGRPRLYTVRELEAADAQGYNRGPWREWHPRIGPTHPNCLCSPWVQYTPALESVFDHQAERWRQTRAQRGVAA